MSVKLLIVDPQMDFMDRAGARGSLAVDGADADMKRLAAMVRRGGAEIGEIYVTMDTHEKMDIAHPGWWRDCLGVPPAPFEPIYASAVESGQYSTERKADRARSLKYLKALEKSGRRTHTIWPEHCVKGTPGHQAHPELMEALSEWEALTGRKVSWVSKGENPFTESFSGFKAEVPDPSDPKTMMNVDFATALAKDASVILVAGEALSHCVAETTRDLADFLPKEELGKIALLKDACSSVGGCEAIGAAFIQEMLDRGARVARTDGPDEALGFGRGAPAPAPNVKTRSIAF